MRDDFFGCLLSCLSNCLSLPLSPHLNTVTLDPALAPHLPLVSVTTLDLSITPLSSSLHLYKAIYRYLALREGHEHVLDSARVKSRCICRCGCTDSPIHLPRPYIDLSGYHRAYLGNHGSSSPSEGVFTWRLSSNSSASQDLYRTITSSRHHPSTHPLVVGSPRQ